MFLQFKRFPKAFSFCRFQKPTICHLFNIFHEHFSVLKIYFYFLFFVFLLSFPSPHSFLHFVTEKGGEGERTSGERKAKRINDTFSPICTENSENVENNNFTNTHRKKINFPYFSPLSLILTHEYKG